MKALEVLTEGLFDYAGMFPPAGLPFEEALRESAKFPAGLRRPGLAAADLVLGFPELAKLSPEALLAAGFPKGKTVRFCVLGSPLAADTGDHAAQVAALRRFNADGGGSQPRRRAVSYELRVDFKTFSARESAFWALNQVRRELAGSDIRLFAEPQWTAAEWLEGLDDLWTRLDRLNAEAGLPTVGLKVRGSGPTAVTNEVLARVIPGVDARSLPFKATAGLHHPVLEERHGNALGFLNVASALRLRRALGAERFPEERLLACLETEDASAFSFEDGLRWRELTAGADALRAAAAAVPFTIGSCSLREPDEDLARLYDAARA